MIQKLHSSTQSRNSRTSLSKVWGVLFLNDHITRLTNSAVSLQCWAGKGCGELLAGGNRVCVLGLCRRGGGLCPKTSTECRGVSLAVSLLAILCRSMPAVSGGGMVCLYKEASSAANILVLAWYFHLCLIWYYTVNWNSRAHFFRGEDRERSPDLIVPVQFFPPPAVALIRRGGWERKQALGSAVGRNFSQRVTRGVMDPALAPLPAGTQPN